MERNWICVCEECGEVWMSYRPISYCWLCKDKYRLRKRIEFYERWCAEQRRINGISKGVKDGA